MAGRTEDKTGATSRAERLAQELRANLARRKAQARERSAQAASGADRPKDGTQVQSGAHPADGDRQDA